MGCGQSKIGNIYSKNRKNKDNSGQKNDSIGSASIDPKNGNVKSNKTNSNGIELNRNDDNNGVDVKNQTKKKTGGPGNGPLLQQAEVSSSQLDFFRMLDEKIENGPDYDETSDEGITDLLRHWELTGMSWSSVTNLKNSSTTSTNKELLKSGRHSLSAKDRECMRNIIGGRPETTPVFIRNANRTDGLQEINCPSPTMPRHALESISQSPTQIVKNSTSPGMSPTSLRLHQHKEYNENNEEGNKINNYQQNGDFMTQQAIYREQYLQQTGIISGSVLRNNSYVQYQVGQENFSGQKRGFSSVELT